MSDSLGASHPLPTGYKVPEPEPGTSSGLYADLKSSETGSPSSLNDLVLGGVQSSSAHGSDLQKTGGTTPPRPWAMMEEDALLAGPVKAKGQPWSQILALYGRGGSISEVLKDRTPGSLRDKARKLKARYLNEGKDVSAALRRVTATLPSRARPRARAAALRMTDDKGQSGDGEDDEEEDAPREVVSD